MVFIGGFSTYISPHSFGFGPFLAYSLPLWSVINLCYLFLILYKRKYRLISAFFVIASLWSLNNTYNISGKSSEGNLRVMSYNVRLFDVYNWLERNTWDDWAERKDKGLVLDSIYRTVQEANPDVIAFQEYFNQPFGKYKTKRQFKKKQQYKYVHDAYSFKEKGSNYGMATFSKYPIISKDYVTFSNAQNNGILVSDIVKGNDTLRILNIHLQSFKFGKEHYKYLRSLKDSTYEAIDLPRTKNLVKQLYTGFNKRTTQLDIVQQQIEKSPYPLIMCGDFNEIPLSYIYEKISDKLDDSFLEAGSGLGITHTSDLPFMRIDYLFTSPEVEAVGYQTLKRELSDHYPILVDLKIN